MDYKFTFEDGSAAIAHYGVKGMKWGQWNPETRARYAGAGNGTFYKKASRGDQYGRAVTDQRRAYNARQPKAKQVAKVALLGLGGAHGYNTARSRGLGRTESLLNASLGPFYAQGVKRKQRKAGTTNVKLSDPARARADYTKNEPLWKSTSKTIIFGTAGSVAYDTVKTRTKSRGKAAVAGVLSAAAVGIGSSLGATAGVVAGMPAGFTGMGVGSSIGSSVGSAAGAVASRATQYNAYRKSKKK